MLRDRGWAAWRIPTSASSAEPLPDVVAVKGSQLVAFEVKYRTKNKGHAYARVEKDQIEKLSAFLAPFALYERRAVVALRVRGRWIFKQATGGAVLVRDQEENEWSP